MSTSSIVTRSALLLDIVCASPDPLAFTEVVKRSGLPKSSVHRVLAILVDQHLLEFSSERSAYRPGERLVSWSANVLKAGRLAEVGEGPMRSLCTLTGAHVALSVLDGHSILYLRTVEAGEPYRHAPGVGGRSPLHASAAGKILLAMMPEERQAHLILKLELEPYNEHTITDRKRLCDNLSAARSNGFAVCDREEFLRVSGVAAAIRNHLGDAVGAISLWHSSERLDLTGLMKFAGELQAQAGKISQRLGWGMSSG